MPEKLEMRTKNLVTENIDWVAEKFPNCITEVLKDRVPTKAVDFDALKQELSDCIVDGPKERYQFTWPDKSKAKLLANSPINMTLRPCPEESVDFENTKNLYIEGDNLDVLKLLRETYLGKIDLIYIDPPYNTGNDFLYNDTFAMSFEEYSCLGGGNYEDYLTRLEVNNSSRGRYHTNWLNMMYSRLLLSKSLLSEGGAVFISIDDNEQSNLKKLCDEIFGEWNYISTFVWAAGRKNDSKYVSTSHEYILCYVKSATYLSDNHIIWRQRKEGIDEIYKQYDLLKKKYKDDHSAIEVGLNEWYSSRASNDPVLNHRHYNKVDHHGIYFPDNISWPGGGGPKYEVLHPITQKPVKIPSRGWLLSETRMKEMISKNRVYFGKDETYVPCLKSYLSEREYSVPYSVFYKDGRAATKRLRTLFGTDLFQNPKDEEVISSIIEFATNKNSLVLDFFSGSGTTAHSVLMQNLMDGGNRSFIMVQIPQQIDCEGPDSSSSKKISLNATNYLHDRGFDKNICEIGKERIRLVGKQINNTLQQTSLDGKRIIDTGFRVLKLDSSNMEDVYYSPNETTQRVLDSTIDNVKKERKPEDLLFQCMLELGIELSASIDTTTIDGRKVFDVSNGYLLACFDKNVSESVITEIAKKKPINAVLRDSSVDSDSTATNFEQIFRTYSPDTKRMMI